MRIPPGSTSAYPGCSLHDDDDAGWDAGLDGDLKSLLEENARLRTLIVQLSDVVLKKVVDQK